jgi:hypothetical protein
MSDELDFKTITVIAGAFAIGYWLVSLLFPRKKRPPSAGVPPRGQAPGPGDGTHNARDDENQRVLEAAQRLREEAAERAERERQRRQD